MATAGDLLRHALEGGSSQLGLAKKLAGSDDDRDPEVLRWRYVVRRAAAGGEPHDSNVTQIAETFGLDLADLDRPQRAARQDRLAALEEEVEQLREALETAGRAHDELLGRVEALETEAPRRAGTRAAGASPRGPRPK